MRRSAISLLLLVVLSASTYAVGLPHLLDSIISHNSSTRYGYVGMTLWDADKDSLLYRYDGDHIHRPASTLKLFTAVSALKYLGLNHRMTTAVYQRGNDLYLVGGMDPSLTSAQLGALASTVASTGVTSVACLHADLSMKDRLYSGKGWCWDDTGGDFPNLSPLLCDARSNGHGIDALRFFADTLVALGIPVADIDTAERSADADLIASTYHTIGDILSTCLKSSNNLYAESILYQLGNLTSAAYPSAADCITKAEQLYQQLGMSSTNHRIVDGSGLSFYNLVTPDQEVKLLRYAYQNNDIYQSLHPALPISGTDGTLSSRMTGTMKGRVYAKTGSLSSVVSLAGYAHVPASSGTPVAGHTLIFSILCDGVAPGLNSYFRSLQDNILTHICGSDFDNLALDAPHVCKPDTIYLESDGTALTELLLFVSYSNGVVSNPLGYDLTLYTIDGKLIRRSSEDIMMAGLPTGAYIVSDGEGGYLRFVYR